MSTLIGFGEYFIFIPILIFLFSFWVIFLKLINNTNLTNTNIEKNKRVPNVNTPKQNYFFILVECYLVGAFFLFLFFWLLRGRNSSLLFNHFIFTEFHIRVFLFFLVTSFSFYFILRATGLSKTDYPIDFFFSLLNMVIFLPLLFCVNNFFTFLFLLELISCFSFYKLVASKIWYKKHLIESPLITVNNEKPNLYINMIFFQYWITFFSTVLILYTLLNIFYTCGSTEWVFFNFVKTTSLTLQPTDDLDSFFLSAVLVCSVAIKLGVSPIHLFKVETYKGIPYLSILFYTTYYFIIIFFMFLCLLDESFLSLVNFYYYLIIFILFIGLVYITSLLFDVSYLKAFFAYSTVINTIGFLVLFISRF
jgi:NADH:ubiquinone oxidoreductase subunit 2 (subunit N)